MFQPELRVNQTQTHSQVLRLDVFILSYFLSLFLYLSLSLSPSLAISHSLSFCPVNHCRLHRGGQTFPSLETWTLHPLLSLSLSVCLSLSVSLSSSMALSSIWIWGIIFSTLSVFFLPSLDPTLAVAFSLSLSLSLFSLSLSLPLSLYLSLSISLSRSPIFLPAFILLFINRYLVQPIPSDTLGSNANVQFLWMRVCVALGVRISDLIPRDNYPGYPCHSGFTSSRGIIPYPRIREDYRGLAVCSKGGSRQVRAG